MEKIYMEENQNQTPKKKRSLLFNTSIMMSFVLAFVAIVSFAVAGFSQVSYAIPDETTTPFPDTITSVAEDAAYTVKGGSASSPLIKLKRATINGTTSYVYCIESAVNIASDANYSRAGKITDKGLLFLLTYLASDSAVVVDGSGHPVDPKAKGWIVQTALWVYLHETGYPNNAGTFFTDEVVQRVRNDTELMLQNDDTPILVESNGIYSSCSVTNTGLSAQESTIAGLIDKAKSIKQNPDSWNTFSLTISKASDTITLSDDKENYLTDLITINGGDGFDSYKVTTSNFPVGTKILDSNGDEIASPDNLTNGTQFRLSIPKKSVTEENKDITISVVAAFSGKTAYYYTYQDMQKIAFSGDTMQHISKGTSISINLDVPTEDTGITAAQSVYFIGLIILLAGVGIIYANIKPREVKEQA